MRSGYVADLLLLDADPLEDIRNTRRIHMVIQGGRIARDPQGPLVAGGEVGRPF